MSELGFSRTQREWWLAALGVLHSPRVVFSWLQDDSDEAAGERQEPIVALVFLAGVAALLSTAAAGRLLDAPEVDGVAAAAWAFIGGAAYGFLAYWAGGLCLAVASGALRARATTRQARHVLGYAVAPLAAALVLVWPLRLAVYGGDVFRRGGGDTGFVDRAFDGAMLGATAWALALLTVGLRQVNGWTWARAVAATLASALGFAGLAVGLVALG